jgi:transposase InsO family protein
MIACRSQKSHPDGFARALAKHGKPEIFNTDQGSQFTGAAFTGLLIKNGIAISMDGKGAWRDNVFIERLWRSVKYEEVYLRAYDNVSEARTSIGRYLDFAEALHHAQGIPQQVAIQGRELTRRTSDSVSGRAAFTARNCERIRISMKYDRALVRSRPRCPPRTPLATKASIRLGVGVGLIPCSIESVRTPCTIGNVPAFLMSIVSLTTPTLTMSRRATAWRENRLPA